MAAQSQLVARLPACRPCSVKKIKCDNGRPQCAPCVQNGGDCVILSLDGTESVSRKLIDSLEQRVFCLRAELAQASSGDSSTEPKATTATLPEGGGISFMRRLFTDPAWKEQPPSIVQGSVPEEPMRASFLPSSEEGLMLFHQYLDWAHVQNPYYLRQDLLRLYYRVFSGHSPEHRPEPGSHDLFRAFMILAVGAVLPYRNGSHKGHPYAYFLAAMQYLDVDFLSRGLGSIQDLLGVARFGIYYHIGTSIWEIIQLCVRLCIEQGLHQPPIAKISLLQEQIQRRVFWECYMIDRYSSTMLDRPFAIADQDIQVELPADANDEDIQAAEGVFPNLDMFSVATAARAVPSETSVFLYCVRLRQVTSQIHSQSSQLGHSREVSVDPMIAVTWRGTIYLNVTRFLQKLENWRTKAPVVAAPRCLYETPEWYNLLYLRECLILVRRAMDLVSKRDHLPPGDLLALCLRYATGTITVFCDLFRTSRVTYTRSYFQTLFAAGLSIMFCLSVSTDLEGDVVQHAVDSLRQASDALKQMGKDLPDASKYVAVYEALYQRICAKMATSVPTGETRVADGFQSSAIISDHQQNLHTDSSTTPPVTSVPLMTDDPLLAFDVFGDDSLWGMEAGLSEYVYGSYYADTMLDENLLGLG